MSKEISSIPQAVMLFGISMIRGFAAANAIKKAIVIDLSPYGKTIDDVSHLSTLQSALVREWYRNVDKSMLPLLQSGAFLMELGKLPAALKVIGSGEFEKFAAEMMGEKPIVEIERCYLGLSSYEIAAMMFEHWNFEALLVNTLKSIDDPSASQNPYASVLNVVAHAVNIRGCLSSEGIEEALKAIEVFGLDRPSFEQAVTTLQSSMIGTKEG